jgi:hypothetical protein
VSKENQIKKKPHSEGSSQIIELASSSESSPVIISARRSLLGPKRAREPVQPSTPSFKNAGTDRFSVEEELDQLGDVFWVEKDDEGDDKDFQLDMSLFEEEGDPHIGPDYSGAMQVKPGPKLSTSVSSASYGPGKESLKFRGEKQEDVTQSRVEPVRKEEVISEEPEDDDMTFDSFFSGVEIV